MLRWRLKQFEKHDIVYGKHFLSSNKFRSYQRQLFKIHRKRAWHNGMGSCHIYFFISINETTLSSEYLLMTKLSAVTVKMVKASFSRVSAKKKELISFRCSRIALTLNSRIFPHTLLRQSITVQRNSLLGKNKQTKKKREKYNNKILANDRKSLI